MRTVFNVNDFATYLRLCLASDGLTRQQLESAMGLGAGTVGTWTKGHYRPRGKRLIAMLQHLPSMNPNTALHLWVGGAPACFRADEPDLLNRTGRTFPTIGAALAYRSDVLKSLNQLPVRYVVRFGRIEDGEFRSLVTVGTYKVSRDGWEPC